jgi:cell division protein FtsB
LYWRVTEKPTRPLGVADLQRAIRTEYIHIQQLVRERDQLEGRVHELESQADYLRGRLSELAAVAELLEQ